MESNEVLKTSLESFLLKSNLILEEVLDEFNNYSDAQKFMSDKKLTKIYQVIQLYKSLYKENSIGHRDELENKFKVFKDDSIQIKIDKFYHFEESLNLFLRKIDQSLSADSANVLSNCNKLLKIGDKFPEKVSVVNVVTSTKVTTDSSFFFPSDEIKHCIVVLLRHFA